MNPRRDAVTVPAASPAPAPLLARPARSRPIRYTRGGFALPGVPGVPHNPGYQNAALEQAVDQLAASGGIAIVNDHGSDLAGRFDDYCLRQFVEAQVRQRIGQGGFQQ